MSFIAKSTIQEVNNRLDAISIVNDYVRLDKKGGRWWGRCPFHGGGQEKTPSFKVDPDLKTYHCFGCGKGGGIIGFVMEMDKLSYPEALKTLARKYGIEIVYEEGAAEDEPDHSGREELFELYRRLTLTFQHFLRGKFITGAEPDNKQQGLTGHDALKYLAERHISEEMIDRFRLGFAPSDRDFLYKFLIQKGYSADFLEKSRLFSSNYKTMALFSGRLMFPIADRQGRVIAFGGRTMPGVMQRDGKEPPKYINSPEQEIFKKGQTLYAFDLSLPEIRQTKTVYLAEGYIDVIALHQAGITNAVAPLGTAFTDEQASLLRRWVEKIVLIFDTDEAGQKAVYRSIIICRKNGLSCAVALLQQGLENEAHRLADSAGSPEEENRLQNQVNSEKSFSQFKDPADILQKFGPQILNKIVKCTINDFEYLISRSRSQYGLDSGGKTRALAFLFPYFEALDSEVERDACITLAADAFGVERSAIQKDFSKRKTGYPSRQEDNGINSGVTQNRPIRMNDELFLLTVVSANMELYPEFRAALEIKEIEDPAAKELFIAMEECFVYEESGIDALLARIKNEPLRNFVVSRGVSPEFKSETSDGRAAIDPNRLMEDGIKAIKKKKLKKRLVEIGAQLRNSERAADSDDADMIDELLSEKMFIDSQIRKLEGRYKYV